MKALMLAHNLRNSSKDEDVNIIADALVDGALSLMQADCMLVTRNIKSLSIYRVFSQHDGSGDRLRLEAFPVSRLGGVLNWCAAVTTAITAWGWAAHAARQLNKSRLVTEIEELLVRANILLCEHVSAFYDIPQWTTHLRSIAESVASFQHLVELAENGLYPTDYVVLCEVVDAKRDLPPSIDGAAAMMDKSEEISSYAIEWCRRAGESNLYRDYLACAYKASCCFSIADALMAFACGRYHAVEKQVPETMQVERMVRDENRVAGFDVLSSSGLQVMMTPAYFYAGATGPLGWTEWPSGRDSRGSRPVHTVNRLQDKWASQHPVATRESLWRDAVDKAAAQNPLFSKKFYKGWKVYLENCKFPQIDSLVWGDVFSCIKAQYEDPWVVDEVIKVGRRIFEPSGEVWLQEGWNDAVFDIEACFSLKLPTGTGSERLEKASYLWERVFGR